MTARLLLWNATLARLFAGRWGLAAVLALTLALALPGFFSLPPVDRDEVLFSQASAQMLASGDLIDVRFADQPRYKKPVGIYWLQAAAAALTGHPEAIWSYRLVSLAGALASVSLTFGIARRLMPPDRAALAALMLAACLILGAEARLAKTDAMLLATVLMGQWVLARAVLPGGKSQTPQVSTLGFWAFWVGS
jgi:4-amino-4-deoxy-L-arabinose transferase-like glycosyltransferase